MRINSRNFNNDSSSNSDSSSLKCFETIRRSSKVSWPQRKPRASPPPYDDENNFEFSENQKFRENDWIKHRQKSKQDTKSKNDITIVLPKNRVAPPIPIPIPTSDSDQNSISNNRSENLINYCSIFWIHHPILKLVLVIICNGFVSMAFAAIFVEVSPIL